MSAMRGGSKPSEGVMADEAKTAITAVAAMRQAWEERFPATPIRGRIKVEDRLGAKVV